MKICLVVIQTSKDSWYQEAIEVYDEKVNRLVPFEFVSLKSDDSSRKDQVTKVAAEEAKILKFLKPDDVLIAFDEKGRAIPGSREFSKFVIKKLEQTRGRLVFLIGGAFGLGPQVKARAAELVTLGPLTLNHQVAAVVATEQIYRALSIWKGLPYHND